jgi:hypothetical protein
MHCSCTVLAMWRCGLPLPRHEVCGTIHLSDAVGTASSLREQRVIKLEQILL